MHTRFATDDGWKLNEGPIIEKGITPMRSFVVEPMQCGRLFLAGDAAHIVPPTGRQGPEPRGARRHACSPRRSSRGTAPATSPCSSPTRSACLRRVWRVQHFSWWMTSMLHRSPGADAFEERLQRAQLDVRLRLRGGRAHAGRELRRAGERLRNPVVAARASPAPMLTFGNLIPERPERRSWQLAARMAS